VGEKVVVRWEFDSARAEYAKNRMKRLFLMRRIALTLAFLAIAAVLVLILVVMFTAQNS
jgi:uncharacterized membrane protein YqjE